MSAPYSRTAADHWDHLSGLSFEARSILTYLLTCRHRTALQAFRVPAAYITADTAAPADVVETALAELETAGRIARDGDAILLVDGHRHDPPGNTNQCLHRVTLVHEGRMPSASPRFRARCLISLAEALERALAAMRPTMKSEECAARESVRSSAEEMRREAASLDPSETVPEGFANGSGTVPESRARGRAGAGVGVGVGGEATVDPTVGATNGSTPIPTPTPANNPRAREARPGRWVENPATAPDLDFIAPTEKQMVMLADRANAAGTTVQAAAEALGIPIVGVNVTRLLRHLEALAARPPSPYPRMVDALADIEAEVRHD